ncbi:MAG: SHOCT domain-containing protein [Desulfuromonadales bacterium]|nr:SHOCT domain-containing protein [Desulfuromonadales bacterium]
MNYILVLLFALLLLVSGCANSANHRVVPVSMAGDETLDCEGIGHEKLRLNTIIDGVEQDKKDVTGADFVDGMLYFPFNIIAKQSNYSNAIKAAEERKEYLTQLSHLKNCGKKEHQSIAQTEQPAQPVAQTEQPAQPNHSLNELNNISQKMKTLKNLHDSELITDQEYQQKKQEILASF